MSLQNVLLNERRLLECAVVQSTQFFLAGSSYIYTIPMIHFPGILACNLFSELLVPRSKYPNIEFSIIILQSMYDFDLR